MNICFEVPGEPKGKARPRITRRGAFTPKSTTEYEERVRNAFRRSLNDPLELSVINNRWMKGDIPLSVEIVANFGIPKSLSKKEKERRKGEPVLKKPDCDNVAKIICDALNGVAYKDDAQVAYTSVYKHYVSDEDEYPYVFVKIKEI